ncbi:MAG: uroporphyrinogen-III synthase [Bacteroidales bacterium]
MKVKNILVSQPKPADLEKSPYGELAKKFNLSIDFRKFIKIEGIPAREFRKDRVSILDHTAVIFTSRNAVDHFFRIAKEMRVEVPDTMKYFCITESTALYLQKYVQYRKRKIFFGNQIFAQLMDVIKKHKSEKFFLPCTDAAKLSMLKMLDDAGIKYSKAIIYKTVSSDLSDIKIEDYDMLIFFSPSGVESLFENFPDYNQGDTVIATLGPATAKAVEKHKLKLNINAPTKVAPSMTMAIDQFLVELKKKKK